MYILRNAALNVWRNRGRNMLLGVIMLVVIATSVIAMMITSTSSGIIADYKDRFSSEVTFEPDIEQIRAEASAEGGDPEDGAPMTAMPSIDADQYLAFGESELLSYASYTATTGIVLDDLTVVDEELGGGTGMMAMGGPPGEEADPDRLEYMASLNGGTFTEFDDGTRAVAEGEMPDGLDEAMVSSSLAELNDLTVGDTITATGQLQNPDQDQDSLEEISYELVVVGIYDDLTESSGDSPMQNAYTNTRNQVLTTYETVLQNYDSQFQGIQVSGSYFLTSPDVLEEFEGEVRAKGLSDSYNVTTDEAAYERIVGPVEGLSSISKAFMIVVLVLGGAIIALLSSIAIRERKYEIGVLRAMGMKKSLVSLGLWIESLMLTAVCLAAGLGIGALIAQPVTDYLLEGQVAAAEKSAQADGMGPGMGGMPAGMAGAPGATGAEPLTALAVGLTAGSIGQIVVVALLLATIAGGIAIACITKYEPMKILAERN
ncbi:ABC transporter permease [Nesterenkonia sp. DZ6]|uniref:ABC transporter permease n=1 Tax=Nesterenkonia sp. DZ6 TaxID=2901229 RepID=UPI001F4D27F8|nr:ABC transporter permease [Nesterenkonia sp. DZ6]MCH8560756.1 ABC transporter permease [Nesterenkonia sp. DZ6]